MMSHRMKPLSTLWTVAILAALALAAKPSEAQVVQIDSGQVEGGERETGHGFLVSHDGSCFVLLPRHVAAGEHLVTVSSAAPIVSGNAIVETPFWEDLDLAIGVVRGEIESRCTATIDSLSTAGQPELAATPRLMRLRSSGEVEELPMRLVGAPLYRTFDAAMTNPGDELFKGTSGALLYAGAQPLGMVVEQLSPTEGRFIRIEEIAMNAGRWLDRRGGNFATQNAAPVALTASGFSVELESASATAIEPETGPDALLGPGAFVFAPQLPVRLVFHVIGDEATALSRVQMLSQAEPGQAIPKDLTIQVSTRAEPVGLRPFGSGVRMGADGLLDVRAGATTARWIVVTINSAWDDGPIRLDNISFE